jgi:NADH:ubiquinone reductase (non-electrogenic)
VGSVEFRSICEPIRKANPLANYYEGRCTDIDPHGKTVTVEGVMRDEYGRKVVFDVPYDIVAFSPGVTTGTFGVPGVVEHCYFIKEIGSHALPLIYV